MNTVNDIKESYDSVQAEYEEAKRELQEAKDKFNIKYNELSEKADPIVNEFTTELFRNLTSMLDVKTASYSPSLTEIFLNDEGMEKISFHNKYYVSAYQPDFTFMIRDNNLNAVEGSIPKDKSPKEVAEFIFGKYQEFIN